MGPTLTRRVGSYLDELGPAGALPLLRIGWPGSCGRQGGHLSGARLSLSWEGGDPSSDLKQEALSDLPWGEKEKEGPNYN